MSGPKLNWGNSLEYNNIFKDFELMITNIIVKGIPLIISEVGVLKESFVVYGMLQMKFLEIWISMIGQMIYGMM